MKLNTLLLLLWSVGIPFGVLVGVITRDFETGEFAGLIAWVAIICVWMWLDTRKLERNGNNG